ncbi:MAG: O-antigen ligase family protein [Thermofilaceae archaeon]
MTMQSVNIQSFLTAGLFGLAIILAKGWAKPKPGEAKCVFWILLTILLAGMIMQLLSSLNILKSFIDYLIVSFFGAFYWMLMWSALIALHLSRRHLKTEWQISSVIGGLFIVAALVTTLLHAIDRIAVVHYELYTFQGYRRPHGILSSPLEAGLVALIGWAWGVRWSLRDNWHALIGLLLVGLSTAVVYLTLSRSAWLGLGIALLVGLFGATRQTGLWKPIVVTLFVFLLGTVCLPLGWNRSVYAVQGDPSVQNRLHNWRQVPAIILLRHPFGRAGTGIEGASIVSTTVNFYLDVAVHAGVISLALLLWLVGIFLTRAFRFVKQGTPELAWGLGTIATLVCLIFMSPAMDLIASALLGGFWGLVSAMEVNPDANARLYTH